LGVVVEIKPREWQVETCVDIKETLQGMIYALVDGIQHWERRFPSLE
jgi:hypothetical protein